MSILLLKVKLQFISKGFKIQGYILNIVKLKEEDLIVKILTKDKIISLYRFYGARHSKIQLGYKLDFEANKNGNSSMRLLQNTIHLGFSWLRNKNKLYLWHNFCKLLNKHLEDIEEIDEFYFNLLEDIQKKIEKQNEKRVLLEAYLTLLKHEGRLKDEIKCLICSKEVSAEVSLLRAFQVAHPSCVFSNILKFEKLKYLLETQSSINLNKDELDICFNTLQEGF